jgi:hypothetical protein
MPPNYFNITGGTLKGYDLNSAFEKADRLLEQKRTSDLYLNRQLTLLSQWQMALKVVGNQNKGGPGRCHMLGIV